MRSSVDREGVLLRVAGPGEEEEDLGTRVATAVARMGYVAQPLDGRVEVSRWFDSAATDELSQEEASVLAERWIGDLALEGVIEEPARVMAPLRAALLETFRSSARTGSVDVRSIDVSSLRSVLSETESSLVRRWIEAKLMRPTSSQ